VVTDQGTKDDGQNGLKVNGTGNQRVITKVKNTTNHQEMGVLVTHIEETMSIEQRGIMIVLKENLFKITTEVELVELSQQEHAR